MVAVIGSFVFGDPNVHASLRIDHAQKLFCFKNLPSILCFDAQENVEFSYKLLLILKLGSLDVKLSLSQLLTACNAVDNKLQCIDRRR